MFPISYVRIEYLELNITEIEGDAHNRKKAVNKASDFSARTDKPGNRKGQTFNSSSWLRSSDTPELLNKLK